ncbi:MAG TPA: hypothetical protein VN040_20155 [Pseudosphingobacterium sp.]|nr:hypothetical protein [Pseudosphingobacterium sp.]
MNIAEQSPEKVIPIMPCPDIQTQVTFYKTLGFDILGVYTSPNPYASLKWNKIELHFWGSRKIVPAENSTMCFIMVRDVDEINRAFTTALKKYYGKIPRTGFPKITKVRNLVDDCRFTLTDLGGNTLFIGSKATEQDRFFRKLDNQEHAKRFAALYDVVYSKEDPIMAENMLPRYSVVGDDLHGLDKAKYLLVVAEIRKHLNKKIEDSVLKQLINQHGGNSKDWKRIEQKYLEILKRDL